MTSNKIFKALADPTRRRVLELLRERPLSAGELASSFPVSKPTMSAHLSVLLEAGLVEAEKNGRVVLYRLRMSVLEDALLGFADAFGIELAADGQPRSARLGSKSAKARPREA